MTDGWPEEVRYAGMRWNTPLSEQHAAVLVALLAVGAHDSVRDLGCGWGELLLHIVEASGDDGCTGVGVDTDARLLERGRMLAVSHGLGQRVSFVEASARDWTGPADRVVCIGASHAWDGTRAALASLAQLTGNSRYEQGDPTAEAAVTPLLRAVEYLQTVQAPSRPRVRARTRTLRVALVAAACAVALVACGSSGRTGYHNPKYPYGAPNLAISMSKCMRANGVPNFPDPREGPNGGGVGWVGGLMITGTGTMVVEGVTLSGPAFVSAEKVCKEYMPPGGPPPAVSEGQRQAALANASCMRSHGVPNFPDPTFSAGGAIDLNYGPGLNQQSPAFKQAAEKCGLLKP